MIYTVTFSPSLDYVVKVNDFALGKTNRTEYESISPGGKGINVSTVLTNLGVDTVAIGFCGGFTGDALTSMLSQRGLKTDLIPTEGLNRINIKLKTDCETEINGQGVVVTPAALAALFDRIDAIVPGDTLVLAGTVPKTLPADIYEQILRRLDGKGVSVVVDATGALLQKVLPFRPFLIKPNRDELSDLFDAEIKTLDDVFDYAKQLQQMGARNVIVSMGGEGAALLSEESVRFYCPAPQGTVVDTVGSGDSMVAGFLAGYLQTSDKLRAFLQGVAAGSASAFREGLATADEIKIQLDRLEKK